MRCADQAVALTEAQEGLWYAQRLDPGNPIFNTGHCTQIVGDLDIACLGKAINQTLREADALSLRFIDDEQGPRQYFESASVPVLQHVDVSAYTDAQARARTFMLDDLRTPIDPTTTPLARHVLIRTASARHLWYQRVHHLATDGYGMALIEKRAMQLYQSLTDGHASGTPLTPFEQVVEDDRQYRQSAKRIKDAAFWQAQLSDLDTVASLSNTSAMTDASILQATRSIDSATIALMRQRQESTQCSWPDVLTCIVAAYVQRHTGQREVVIGVPWMGRMGNVSARSVATVMNIAPLRMQIDQAQALDALIKTCSGQLMVARRHGRYRSEQLRRDLGLLGGLRRLHGPLINILPFDAAYERSSLDAHQEVLCAGPVEDLNFNFRAAPDGGSLRLEIEANPRLYTEADVNAHMDRLIHFLGTALNHDTLLDVQTLTPVEFHHWVHTVNQTAHPVPDSTLDVMTAAACAQCPQNEALRFRGKTIAFQQFDALVTNAARHLRHSGVKAGDIVAVALPRSDELVLSLHAIIRAGAAYLPLDIDQPAERIGRILASAKPAAAIGNAQTLSLLDASCTLHDTASLLGIEAKAIQWPAPEPDSPAYVLYTSGSTGEPKGVIISHRAIVNRLLWMKDHYGLSPHQRFLQKTPCTFDVSVWELFLPMLCGASLVIAEPGAHRDPRALAEIIKQERITVVHFVPSMLAAFLNEPASLGLKLDQVFCSGEALPATLRDRFHERIQADLHNLYGPTEAAVDVTYWPASKTDASDPLPIGFAVWNTQLYILDQHLRPVAPGTPGALYLGGRQLAQGYLGRADLTAARFVPNPFSPQTDARMYETGDLARWRSDGAVVYLGRQDDQIKLRGQRIELGEIETVLGRHPACRQVAVVAREDKPGELRIVAYAVPHAQHAPDTQALLDYAHDCLPDYMVPSAVVWLAQIPVNRNGKLDRKSLPVPQITSGAGRAPQTNTELAVAAQFQAILGLSTCPAADDDFFTLGGHSLLAARLASSLRDQFSDTLTLGAIFEHPTVARLAACLDALGNPGGPAQGDGFGPTFTLRPDTGQGRPALFCIHPAGGLSWCYGLLARRLPSARPVYGIQSPAVSTSPSSIVTLRQLASHYADQIQAMQSEGPYHLLGWSVGGIIVHEVACELAARNARMGVACLLDAYPGEAWRNRPEPGIDAAYKAILHIAGHDPDALTDVPLNRDGVVGFLRRSGHALGELTDRQLNGILDSVAWNNRMVRQHHHRRYEGELLYFRAALDHAGEDLHPDMWRPWAAKLAIHDIASLHAHLTGESAVSQFLPTLNTALNTADAKRVHTEQPCNC